MTLQLRLIDIHTQTMKKKPLYIYVEGSQAGSLRLTLSKLPQTIKCSSRDHLKFIVCGQKSQTEPQNGDIIGIKDFWASATLDQNRQKWQNISASEKGSPFVLQYFNNRHEKQGDMKFEVKYNRGHFYQGQMKALDSIRLRVVPFYKGRCPTHNFYNCLDARQGPSQFNFIEHLYRDE